MCVEDLDFTKVVMWVQVQGLSLDMLNAQNAECIGSNIGRCISVETEQTMKQNTFFRLQLEIDTSISLMEGFWWVNSRGQDKWASIRYERLSDLCFGCGRIGHTSHHCVEKVIMDEAKQGSPLYGPWIIGVRPRMNTRSFHIGGGSRPPVAREDDRQSWMDVMRKAGRPRMWGRVRPLGRRNLKPRLKLKVRQVIDRMGQP